MPSLFSIRSSLTRLLFLCVVFFIIAPYAHADFNSTATSWSNFGGSNGYTSDYTYKGQMIADHETSADPSNGGSSVPPDETDLASCSPDSPPGMCPTPAFGYYDGGTPYDPDNPPTLEDDYIFFRMRIRGDAAHKAGFKSYHWNVLLDAYADGYKEYWVDLEGSWTADNTAPDRLRILYNNENRQDIPDPDVAQVNYFSAYNNGSQSTSHTRLINVGDGSGDYWIEIQVPMTAFNDLSGNQVLFPNSPVAFVFSTGSSNQDPLQKDHMMDLKFLSNSDPIRGQDDHDAGEPEEGIDPDWRVRIFILEGSSYVLAENEHEEADVNSYRYQAGEQREFQVFAEGYAESLDGQQVHGIGHGQEHGSGVGDKSTGENVWQRLDFEAGDQHEDDRGED